MAMEMDHSFTVPVSPDRAWDVLLDVERIAPCMPGATVDDFDGEVVTGRIKVKVGPVSLTYRGTAKFTERDADARHIVLEASGKETRGAGTASATVQASLESEPGGQATKVSMHTTMNVTGRPAQFGRGVMVEVGGKLVEQFAQNLRQLIADGGTAAPAEAGAEGAATAEEGADAAPSPGDQATTSTAGASSPAAASASSAPATSTASAPPAAAQADSINLVRLVGPAILKRVIPVAAGLAVLALLGRRFRHLFRRGAKD
jgi:carbon monoxide dehydrogenase subunit G